MGGFPRRTLGLWTSTSRPQGQAPAQPLALAAPPPVSTLAPTVISQTRTPTLGNN